MAAQLDSSKIQLIIEAAKEVKQLAYCPYSQFRVGAAVLCSDGSLFKGCNVENASYGLTVCAERAALCQAVAHGHRDIVAVGCNTDLPGEKKCTPCGACRQFIAEFGSDVQVVTCNADGTDYDVTTASQLLPLGFNNGDLEQNKLNRCK